jgi:hypothetical protein
VGVDDFRFSEAVQARRQVFDVAVASRSEEHRVPGNDLLPR